LPLGQTITTPDWRELDPQVQAEQPDAGKPAGLGLATLPGSAAQPLSIADKTAAAAGASDDHLPSTVVPARFRPSNQDDLAPSGSAARLKANIQALTILRTVQGEARAAIPAEQALLARWSGWGAVPEVFDASRDDVAWARHQLAALLGEEEMDAARRSTFNAHYTDAALVQTIWAAAQGLGFETGRVLEPGCGSGNFIGFAPDGADVVGVELEPTTAAIARHLYPDAHVLTESFAETRAPEGTFDLVIGNVPFGQVVLNDRRHNPGAHTIHNHFIIKALHLTRPGGLVMLLTSRYTLDAKNPGPRREMEHLADLVGAVRLPSHAHRRAAGTGVVTDLLILRRRELDREPQPVRWEQASPRQLPGGEVAINDYFHAFPQRVLGELTLGRGMYGPGELLVTGPESAAGSLGVALSALVDEALERGLGIGAPLAQASSRPAGSAAEPSRRPEGYLEALASGGFTRIADGYACSLDVPKAQAAELRQLLRLRDTVVALLEAEAGSIDDTAEIVGLRRRLNYLYDSYGGQYGPINRFEWRHTGRLEPLTGEERLARVRPRVQSIFRRDPYANAVLALEDFDPLQQDATKADICRERVIGRRSLRLGADTPADALAICLDTHGRVDLVAIARLLGTDEDSARAGLGDLVFQEPGTARLIHAAEYLSGNVRQKLAAAETATAEDPGLEINVAALRQVLPPDLGPGEITARPGAAWIEANYVQQFLQETLGDASIVVEHPGGSTWTVRSSDRYSVLSTSVWGTSRYPAPSVAQSLLEQRQIRIYDELPEGRRVLNMAETVAAQAKATELAQHFSEWIWEDAERAADLARIYNERFNSIVLRSYDGVELSLPGLALTFKPHPHQLAAVARIITEPATGLYHEVGAGKTAAMVMGAMELRRLGLVQKPAFVVPNHMLEQFSREFLWLYPKAHILAAQKEDLERDRRRLFVGRCATGNWDAVIMTESAFQRIPMSVERQREYLHGEIETIERQLTRSKQEGGLTVKRLEQAKLQAEERIKKLLDSQKDPGVTFEETGIDYLFRDEGHRDKNLRTPSNIPGAGIDGSQRASDMFMKLAYLRKRNPARWGTRATATPISNSMTEMYTETRFQRPDLLEEMGIEEFDQWAATFGETVSAIEVAPDGSGFRLKARFAKFVNVPELLRVFHVFGDVKTAEDLNLPTPLLAMRPGDGVRAPETVVVPSSLELEAFMDTLAKRAEVVRAHEVDPEEDNMLSISTDGRLAALHLRLVGVATDRPGKVDVAADRIAAVWSEHRERVYRRADGSLHPVPGSLQIVFSDLGTPKPGAWSVYEELRSGLAKRGVPQSAVRFIHEAKNDREKGELFAACRNGQVAALTGSTERMGVGTNVQNRAVALHHLDCPWRPADIRQREGRILRQGNWNEEVRIMRYVTEGSFDGFIWGLVERKARYISQVMRGRLDVREVEDIGDPALSYQEVKALATGNPLWLDQAQAQADLARLERLERAHERDQRGLRSTIRRYSQDLDQMSQLLAATEVAISRRRDTRGDAFAMVLDDQTITSRPEAEARLRALISRLPSGFETVVGRLGGFDVAVVTYSATGEIYLKLIDLPEEGVGEWRPKTEIRLKVRVFGDMKPEDLVAQLDRTGAALITRLENKVRGLEAQRDAVARRIDGVQAEVTRAEGLLGRPFPQAERLAAARARLQAINAQLEDMAEQAERAPTPAARTEPAMPGQPAGDAGSEQPTASGQRPLAAEPGQDTDKAHPVSWPDASAKTPPSTMNEAAEPPALPRNPPWLPSLEDRGLQGGQHKQSPVSRIQVGSPWR
jgi:N12 class adenine-specific DNA methylase/SAM-dependent methyltransferase